MEYRRSPLSWSGIVITSAISSDGVHFEGVDFSGGWNFVWNGENFLTARMNFIASLSPNLTKDEVFTFKDASWDQESKSYLEDGYPVYLNVIGFNGQEYIAAGYRSDNFMIERNMKDTTFFYSTDGRNWEPITMKGWDTDIEAVFPTSFGFILTGNNVWAVSRHPFREPSSWAQSAIDRAKENGLVSDSFLQFYQADLTRAQASELVVRLYEKLKDFTVDKAPADRFTDTMLEDVLKANQLGIVFGKENGKFQPQERVSRQDFAVMIDRTLNAAGIAIPGVNTGWGEEYTDLDQVAPYADKALLLLNGHGVMKGVGNSLLAPGGHTTKEEAIVLIERLFEKLQVN